MGKMMKAAQETQEKMVRMQEDLAYIEVIGESGAGLVKATATAKGELTGLEIDPSIFNKDEKAFESRRPHKGLYIFRRSGGDILPPDSPH